MNKPLLSVKDLSKSFTPETILWEMIEFTLQEGQSLSIYGESGSGKSTLLFTLGGLEPVQSGEIFFQNQPIRYKKGNAYVPGLSYIFQHYQLIEELNVEENILWPTYLGNRNSALYKTIVEDLELGALLRRMPLHLSGGERQRVAIARALVTEPKLVLADEPTGSLDIKTGTRVMDLFFYICNTLGTSFILVTHNLDFARRTKQQFFLKGGRLIDAKN